MWRSWHILDQFPEYYFLYISEVNRKLSYYLCCFSLRKEDVLLLHIIAHDILGQCLLKRGLKFYYTEFSSFSKILFQNSLFLISLYLQDLVSSARIHQANERNYFLQPFVHKNSIVDYCLSFFFLILLISLMC